MAEREASRRPMPPRRSSPATEPAPASREKRLRRVLVYCCRALVRAETERRLLDAQCRFLLQAGYEEVAVLLRESSAGGLEVRAHAGARRLPALLRNGKAAALQGPIRRTLDEGRTGTAVPASDGLGTGDLCIVPLPIGGRPRGVLLVHSRDGAPFSRDEIVLLEELARDIGYGVAGLRERHRQRSLAARLRAAEERYAGIFENAREGIFAATRGGRIKLVNPAFARLVGYASPAQFLASPNSELPRLLPRDDHARLAEALESGATDPPLELTLRHRDGNLVRVSMNVQVVETGYALWIEGFVQDLTLLYEERQATGRLAAIVEESEEAIFSKTLSGVIQTWNRGAEALYGYSAEEALGRVAADLIIPPDLVDQEEKLLEAIRANAPVPLLETKHRRKDGSTIDVAVSASPMRSASGEVVGAALTAHDITSRKKHEQTQRALEQQRLEVRRLEDMDRLRTSFINEAAHELKTPLTPIITHLGLLLSRDDLNEDVRRSLLVLNRNANRMHTLVRDMLDISRLDAGRPALAPQPVDLGALLDETAEAFLEAAQRAKVGIDVQREPDAVAWADRARVIQVLYNLLQNAINFCREGGRILLRAQEKDGRVLVTVRDEGRGLDQEQLRQLFQPFAMLHDPARGPPGTGLGLFIAKKIVEQHGGQIWAESNGPGHGLTVRFTLPRSEDSS